MVTLKFIYASKNLKILKIINIYIKNKNLLYLLHFAFSLPFFQNFYRYFQFFHFKKTFRTIGTYHHV